jgi:undecaprenyl-phosphate 4-deoxy-4-formamido-L-arabinose transferase
VIYTYYPVKEHAFWRNLGSRFNGWVADFLLEKPKGLYLSSHRCISAFVVDHITRYSGPFPYVDGLILQTTSSIGQIEVQHLPSARGRSNYTLRRLFKLWLNMFVNFSVIPLHISTLTGVALSVAGGVATLLVLFEALYFGTPRGWGSLMAAILLLSGVQLVMLGLIGEYLGRVFLTSNGKPQSVVADISRNESAARHWDGNFMDLSEENRGVKQGKAAADYRLEMQQKLIGGVNRTEKESEPPHPRDDAIL